MTCWMMMVVCDPPGFPETVSAGKSRPLAARVFSSCRHSRPPAGCAALRPPAPTVFCAQALGDHALPLPARPWTATRASRPAPMADHALPKPALSPPATRAASKAREYCRRSAGERSRAARFCVPSFEVVRLLIGGALAVRRKLGPLHPAQEIAWRRDEVLAGIRSRRRGKQMKASHFDGAAVAVAVA